MNVEDMKSMSLTLYLEIKVKEKCFYKEKEKKDVFTKIVD